MGVYLMREIARRAGRKQEKQWRSAVNEIEKRREEEKDRAQRRRDMRERDLLLQNPSDESRVTSQVGRWWQTTLAFLWPTAKNAEEPVELEAVDSGPIENLSSHDIEILEIILREDHRGWLSVIWGWLFFSGAAAFVALSSSCTTSTDVSGVSGWYGPGVVLAWLVTFIGATFRWNTWLARRIAPVGRRLRKALPQKVRKYWTKLSRGFEDPSTTSADDPSAAALYTIVAYPAVVVCDGIWRTSPFSSRTDSYAQLEASVAFSRFASMVLFLAVMISGRVPLRQPSLYRNVLCAMAIPIMIFIINDQSASKPTGQICAILMLVGGLLVLFHWINRGDIDACKTLQNLRKAPNYDHFLKLQDSAPMWEVDPLTCIRLGWPVEERRYKSAEEHLTEMHDKHLQIYSRRSFAEVFPVMLGTGTYAMLLQMMLWPRGNLHVCTPNTSLRQFRPPFPRTAANLSDLDQSAALLTALLWPLIQTIGNIYIRRMKDHYPHKDYKLL